MPFFVHFLGAELKILGIFCLNFDMILRFRVNF